MMMMLSRLPRGATCVRTFATRRSTKTAPLPPQILDNLPTLQEVAAPEPSDPAAYRRNPVTSAHHIAYNGQVSKLDSAALSPKGTVVHGQYGDLGELYIPLEYLALLRPAAEGAAALRVTLDKSKHAGHGTILIYGASQADGLAAAQLASSAGHAVVGVVDAQHSGNELLVESIKGLIAEPGTAVPEEYAIVKKNFLNLVEGISKGDEGIAKTSAEEYLAEFKENFLAYTEAYPDSRPAAVSEERLDFKFMEKDREYFEQNMQAYLEQYPPGAPSVDEAKLKTFFNTEQYQIFRDKFWEQTTHVISGGESAFSPPHIVKHMSEAPEKLDHRTFPGAGPTVPYSFSILDQVFPRGTEIKAGGPVLGAIISVTPDLKAAADKVGAAKTLRAKGEALAFLTRSQKAAYSAACSVAAAAKKAGAPIVTVGGQLPGLDTVKATEADVKEAISAMDIDENGNTRLNYFVQVYRASDFPFYADYAIHRASEPLAGPRQIIVTK